MNCIFRSVWVGVALIVTVALSGCGVLMRKQGDQSIAGAAALDSNLVSPTLFYPGTSRQFTANQKKDYIGAVVLDSVQKCRAFINALTLDEGDASFLGDSFSTLFSALATVTKPINTVHGLTASATIASGTKNAYLSGYFANATIANFGMAMQTSYLSAMRTYVDAMPDLDYDAVIIPIEISKIESVHSLCSMASAQYVITKTLGDAASKPPASNMSVQLDFGSKDTASVGDQATLTVTLINGSGKAATLTDDMTVDVGATPATIYSVKGLSFSNSSCNSQLIKSADDGMSFSYQKSAVVPSGSCTIKVAVKATDAGTVTAEVKASALKTDQGANANGTGTKSITFVKKGAKSSTTQIPAVELAPVAAPAPARKSYSRTSICVTPSLGKECH